VDGRADLHSLAAVAFEALGGGPPAFKADRAGLVRTLRTARPDVSPRLATALVAPLAEQPDDRPATAAAWLAALGRAEVRPWRPWAAAGVITVGGAVALRLLLGSHEACRLPRDAPARLAVMPFAVLGTPPYPATQLPEYFISRFRPVEHLSEVVSFGRVVAQIASEHPSNEEAQALACRLGAKFFVQGSVAYVGPTVTLQATLYEGGRARRSAKSEGRVGAEASEGMDRVWAGLYPEFTPGADATLPNGGPEALAAYLTAEAAFRRGDYRTARDEYTRVIRADTGFAIGRLRLALVAAQVDPTEQGFGASLRGAVLHQRGLSSADSLLLDGFAALLSRGDGLTALARFKSATESAPAYPQAWYVLGEFYYHFAGLFDQSVGEARVAFNRVLDLDPRFSPAIGHLIALAHQAGDRAETERLIRQYLRIDSTSVVAEAVGIADTLILGSPADQLALLKHVCGHSFLALQYLAFQAAAFGTKAQREGPARAVLKCLPQRGAGDQERVRALLPTSLAADLQAHAALARGDSSAALQLWDGATRRYAVLSAPLELVASLWPLRLELVRVAVARGDSTAVARGCASFDALMGYA